MCDALSWTTFGLSAAQSVHSYGQEKQGVRSRNRRRLQQFNIDNEFYVADSIIRDTAWKDSVLNTQITNEDLTRQLLARWSQQDMEIEAAYAKNAWDQVKALSKMYKDEYAGEQTGVTAQRLANEPIRQAGFEITKSMSELMLNKDAAMLNKEILRNETNQKRRAQWRQTRQSPIPGPTPIPEPLEAEPGIGGLLGQLALAGATAYVGGKFSKGDWKWNEIFGKGGGEVAKEVGKEVGKKITPESTLGFTLPNIQK